ncbi:c-type cytochrome [Neptunicella sp. SCSIO 80796]|uniref:c-type cytochrome n=1 Tax=Neptunicella plasticusilytica TaxID=3117012 RepID=UPI003A4E2187
MNLKALLVVLMSLVVFVSQATDMSKEEIKQRIKPVGQVTVAGAVEETAASSGPRSGEDVFKASCFACHGTGAMGAPKKGDAGAWEPRIEQGEDVLIKHALSGYNAMPPKGTCGDCSEDEIKAAIEYMIEGL